MDHSPQETEPNPTRDAGAEGREDALKLWIGNIEPGTQDDDIRGLVKKYAPSLECTKVRRVEGDGSRPAAVLEFAETPLGSLEAVSMRLHGMHWKGRELFVQTIAR